MTASAIGIPAIPAMSEIAFSNCCTMFSDKIPNVTEKQQTVFVPAMSPVFSPIENTDSCRSSRHSCFLCKLPSACIPVRAVTTKGYPKKMMRAVSKKLPEKRTPFAKQRSVPLPGEHIPAIPSPPGCHRNTMPYSICNNHLKSHCYKLHFLL